jgi:hypothetical protein
MATIVRAPIASSARRGAGAGGPTTLTRPPGAGAAGIRVSRYTRGNSG